MDRGAGRDAAPETPVSHWMTLDDWDSDGINKTVRCDCKAGGDHHQLDDDTGDPGDCSRCSAILDQFGRCWYCDHVWSGP